MATGYEGGENSDTIAALELDPETRDSFTPQKRELGSLITELYIFSICCTR